MQRRRSRRSACPSCVEAGGAATEPGLANTVSEVNPSGPVQPGTTITLTYLTESDRAERADGRADHGRRTSGQGRTSARSR